ncbi:hypothetical protein GTZ99_15835 [Novosphingobium sp. FSY-8]|uniref:Uncharacterized protein n=1 Tax=Novosphingobium ovatum TaxID=1908523 RepID=A0ABW9XHI3_9SPHN|nr:hypothetical protein [Novosphingobium ovatum]NBC38025.1 hypothetical protein [Novosphingobium ovatum]
MTMRSITQADKKALTPEEVARIQGVLDQHLPAYNAAVQKFRPAQDAYDAIAHHPALYAGYQGTDTDAIIAKANALQQAQDAAQQEFVNARINLEDGLRSLQAPGASPNLTKAVNSMVSTTYQLTNYVYSGGTAGTHTTSFIDSPITKMVATFSSIGTLGFAIENAVNKDPVSPL